MKDSQNYTIFKAFIEEFLIFDLQHINTKEKFSLFCSDGGLNAYLDKTNNYKNYQQVINNFSTIGGNY